MFRSSRLSEKNISVKMRKILRDFLCLVIGFCGWHVGGIFKWWDIYFLNWSLMELFMSLKKFNSFKYFWKKQLPLWHHLRTNPNPKSQESPQKTSKNIIIIVFLLSLHLCILQDSRHLQTTCALFVSRLEFYILLVCLPSLWPSLWPKRKKIQPKIVFRCLRSS